MLKSVVRAVGAAVRVSSATASTARALPLCCPTLCSPSSATARPFTRSLWMLNNNGASSGYRPQLFSSRVWNPSVSCGCGGLHTEGDKAFGDFLSDEIKEEQKIQKTKTLPKMSGGWELGLNGTEAKLTRHFAGDKISVTFNVNTAFLLALRKRQNKDSRSQQQQQKKSQKWYEMSHGEGEEESDIFAIREVSFQPEGDDEWKETSYTLGTDSLDWALYDHLMDFLADRGVDNTFADELMELSTAIEHQEYIKFLENLQGFVKCN
ncbi:unnamed protein product [Pleuronectes platessa]|uniref:Complement component 1 Q subcomponent-binding protein, mitochondrial n=1 Tax=Pleuronectes platessa TaxID=8262 RepID=A0A9N7YLE2_PLEPL|nr:unnamed protein product [Pleuronectes platessa]